MISLKDTQHKDAAYYFYKTVEAEVKKRLEFHKSVLEKFNVKNGSNLHDYLKKNVDDFLKNDLEISFNNHQPQLEVVFYDNYISQPKKNSSDFIKAIDNIFFYSEYDKWSAYKVLAKLGVNCCPYCNRTYVTTLGNDKKKFYRADFDHFLSKSNYPYFRFHFYNLIPSCIICNQRAKGQGHTNLRDFIYPYKDSFGDDAKFTYIPTSYDELKKGKGSKILIIPTNPQSEKGKKIQKNIDLFRLNQQYLTNTRELHFVIEKKDIHSDGYIKMLMESLPHLFKSESEAYEFIFGKSIDEKDFIHQPLAKFTKDISEELGLI